MRFNFSRLNTSDLTLKWIFRSLLACSLFFLNTPNSIAQAAITFPNVFSPNGDGTNEEFSVNLNGVVPASYQIDIYNRWGVLMFSSPNSNISWDGRNSAGIKAIEDTYYYVAKINDTQYSGQILLCR